MKKILLLIPLLFVLQGCITTSVLAARAIYKHKKEKQTASDPAIQLSAKHALANDPALANSHINVTVFRQLVLLTGQVPTEPLRQHAVKLVKAVPNIKRIYNAMDVGPSASFFTSIDDTWITTKVKSKLIASNDIDHDAIKVLTEKRVVYLMGIVPQRQGNAAANLASRTSGVIKVVKIFHYITLPKMT